MGKTHVIHVAQQVRELGTDGVDVEAVPANGWGLYTMHGNVCE